MVGWAAVAWTRKPGDGSDSWQYVCGTLPPGSSVAQGEAKAVEVALSRLAANGTAVTDCWGVQRLWVKAGRGALDDGGPLFVYQRAFAQRRQQLECDVRWVPAHRSAGACLRDGLSLADWTGNGVADSLAKWAADCGGPPLELAVARTVQKQLNERVLQAAGNVLLRRLQARLCGVEGSAIKAVKRKTPALPRRLHKEKRPRHMVAEQPRPAVLLGDLLHWRIRAHCSPEQARELVWHTAEPVAELHRLMPVGPWPAVASQKAVNGRLCWLWHCARCPARASDSSRALDLLRRPCGGAARFSAQRAKHMWEGDPVAPTCSRCKLVCSNGRQLTPSEQHCPVPECTLNGEPWPAGERSLRTEMGRLHGFRRWCEASSVTVALAAAGGGGQEGPPALPGPPGPVVVHEQGAQGDGRQGVLDPVRFHLDVKLGRQWWCLLCFCSAEGGVAAFRRERCIGAGVGAVAPAPFRRAVTLFGPWAGLRGPAQARVAELLQAFGAAAPEVRLPASSPPGLSTTVIGRALLGAARGARGAAVPGVSASAGGF